jgi:hypothetical protein
MILKFPLNLVLALAYQGRSLDFKPLNQNFPSSAGIRALVPTRACSLESSNCPGGTKKRKIPGPDSRHSTW